MAGMGCRCCWSAPLLKNVIAACDDGDAAVREMNTMM
jgi:hypothetical protein